MVARQDQFIPYCGLPSVPAEIWERWNLDPVLLAVLASLVVAHVAGARRVKLAPGRQALFLAGWAVLAAAFVSPLCNLGVALFSARAVQHTLILTVALPLIVLGHPAAMAGVLPERWRSNLAALAARMPGALASTALFAVLLWFWHSPRAYDATLQNNLAYWAMHISLIAAGLLLWSNLIAGEDRAVASIAAGFASSLQMGLLGALITLTPRALYSVHAGTTAPWGLSQLGDQQLGGLVMWIPGCSVFLIAAVVTMATWLRRMEERNSRPFSPVS